MGRISRERFDEIISGGLQVVAPELFTPIQGEQSMAYLEEQNEKLTRANQILKDAILDAKEHIQEQDKLLKRLTQEPLRFAVVVEIRPAKKSKATKAELAKRKKEAETVGEDYVMKPEPWKGPTAIIIFEGREVEVALPDDISVKVGDTVKVASMTMQIIDVVPKTLAGDIVMVTKVIDDSSCEIDLNGASRSVYSGPFAGTIKDGDRIVIDPSGMVVIRNLGQEAKNDSVFAFTEKTNVTWEQIGGLVEAKKQMMEAIEAPFKFAEYYKFYGKKSLKGLLLYGPPGCGKTLLGKAAANSLLELHNGAGADTCFMYIKAPEILNKYVGASESTIRRIFAAAREHKREHGYPAVIFIDEADAILGKRGSGISSDIERTIVPMFLAEMDGFEDPGAVVLLATNRPDTLDPAIVRDGRIDRKVKVTRPREEDAVSIFKLNLAGKPLSNGYTHDELAMFASSELFDAKHVLYNIHMKDGSTRHFTLGNLASGALVAGIADRATSLAMHKDIASGFMKGLSKGDLRAAVEAAFEEVRDLNHDDDITDFIADFRTEIRNIEQRRAR